MRYKCLNLFKTLLCVVLIFNMLILSGCTKKEAHPNYHGIKEFAEYVNDNAEIEPLYWDIDIDKDCKILNITIEMQEPEPFSKIDSIRIAANKFLEDNPNYFLNEYLIRIRVTTTDSEKLYYAKFSNTEDIGIPAYEDKGTPQYDSLCAVEVLVAEDDLEYIAELEDIVSIRLYPEEQKSESLMVSCFETVSSMNWLTDVYVVGNWYDYFCDSKLECTIHKGLGD